MVERRKRPTHESDAMSVLLSDSVAPRLVEKLREHGDVLSAVIALSYEMSPQFWRDLYVDTVYSACMLKFFKKLRGEGKPLKREWLLRIKRFVSKYNDNVAARPCLVLLNGFAGIKAWTIEIPEYASKLIIDVLNEQGRRKERFELPVVP